MLKISFVICETYSEVVIGKLGTTRVLHGDGTVLSAIALIVNQSNVAPVFWSCGACRVVAVFSLGCAGEERKGGKCHKGSDGGTGEKHGVGGRSSNVVRMNLQ
jgi:hypothetical protein